MFCEAMRESEGKSELSQFLLISRDFIPESKLMPGRRLTHAFRCIIWFFQRNNLVRVNRLGTLCMAGWILEQTKNMVLA